MISRPRCASPTSPTAAAVAPALRLIDLIPVAGGGQRSYFALHEWIGQIWYGARAAWAR